MSGDALGVRGMTATVTAKSVEATDASKAILRLLHPGEAEVPAAKAIQEVAEVLGLAKILQELAEESAPGDWRAVAAKLLRRMRG